MRRVVSTAIVFSLVAVGAAAANAKVLRVGTYKGIRGQFKSIQAAVDAAKPNDWILVGPGDYKEHSGQHAAGRQLRRPPCGRAHHEGRGSTARDEPQSVVVDGTKPGSRDVQQQVLRPGVRSQAQAARHSASTGCMVWKARQRLGPEPDRLQLPPRRRRHRQRDLVERRRWEREGRRLRYYGSYLNATSTYYNGEDTAAQYGIFSSNWNGGTWAQTRTRATSATRATTSALVARQCNQVVDHVCVAVQRARVLGLELGRQRSSSRTRSSITTRTASTPTARTATTRPRRTARARRQHREPDHPHDTRAGCSWTTSSTTTTTRTSPRPGPRRPVRLAPDVDLTAAATTRS